MSLIDLWSCSLGDGVLLKTFEQGIILQLRIISYFFFFLLCWVFVSVRGLSLVVASGGHSSSRCAGLSLSWPFSCCGAQAPDAQAQ